jgi:ribonuclease I
MARFRSSLLVRSSLAVMVTMALAAGLALAQDRRQNRPDNSTSVLSLSWSPSFCDSAGERGTPHRAMRVRHSHSWCMACGRNMSVASQNSVRCRRRDWTATS